MAKAVFHSLRGEKSALISIKANKFVFGGTFVYVPRQAIVGMEPGEEFEIPDGFRIVDMVDLETGEIRTAKDGSPLKVLAW